MTGMMKRQRLVEEKTMGVTMYRTKSGIGWLALAASVMISGCAGQAAQIQMEETVLRATPEGDGHQVEAMDPEVLFHEAAEAYKEGDYDAAERRYGLILEHFPGSRWAALSHYNRAVCLKKLERYADAAVIFGDIAQKKAGTKDAHDALFQLAPCHEKLEQWADVEAALSQVLAPAWKGIVASDRLEALARRGMARKALGNFKEAERELRKVVDVWSSNRDDVLVRESVYVSVAEYNVGEMHRERFAVVKFRLPVESMDEQLAEKVEHFLRAQNAYLRTVRHHHPDYAVKAGFQLGALFEVMTDDMMDAEVPDDMSQEEMEVYREELRKELVPLAEKAVDIFKRTMRLARKFGHDGEWLKRTESSLQKMKDLMAEDEPPAATN